MAVKPLPGTSAGKYGSNNKPPPKAGLGINYNPGPILQDPGVWEGTTPGNVPGVVQPPPPSPPQSQDDFTKNYINTAWDVTDAQNASDQSIAGAENSFQDQLRRAFIDFGGQDVSKLGDYAKYIDDATLQAAKDNKFSSLAQNLKKMTANLRQRRAAAAASGMLSSGRTTTDTQRQLEDREGADYSALRGYLGGAEAGQQSLNQLKQSYADKIAAARRDAAARAADEYWATIGAPQGEAAAAAATTPTPWKGISWGGTDGITTKAGLKAKLGYGQSLSDWAKNHPTAWAKLT